jgi:hydrogenase nickel incorporation protein HypA/HybF
MHELALVEDILAAAEARANGARIKRVVLEVGKLSTALPDALRFCFSLATEGTPAEGALLEIIEVPGSGRCLACGATVEMHAPLAQCACGGAQLEWLSGEGLKVTSLEVA